MKEADKVIHKTYYAAFTALRANCDRDEWWSPMYLSPAFSNISTNIFQSRQTRPTRIRLMDVDNCVFHSPQYNVNVL